MQYEIAEQCTQKANFANSPQSFPAQCRGCFSTYLSEGRILSQTWSYSCRPALKGRSCLLSGHLLQLFWCARSETEGQAPYYQMAVSSGCMVARKARRFVCESARKHAS